MRKYHLLEDLITYEKSCELIYTLISSRIKIRRYDLKLTNNDIHENDVNLVSVIANYRLHQKKESTSFTTTQ